jgi:hypothetical protein
LEESVCPFGQKGFQEMSVYQRLCNGQKAYDQVVIQGMISREDNLLTMPAERVNAILVAFNEGRTLEEAQRLAEEFLGVLGSVRAAFIYSATMADEGRLTDKTAYTVQINQPERSLEILPCC